MSTAPAVRTVCGLVLTAAALVILAPSSRAATLIHVYELNGTLADELGGPALISDGGLLGPASYSFESNQGLSLTGGLPNPGVYTIELTCHLGVTSGYRKLIDYLNLDSDDGLYVRDGTLEFYPLSTTTAETITPDVMACITLTRDAAGNLTGYVNGVQQWIVGDAENLGVVGADANVLRFFEDDDVTGQGEASPGVVDRIRIWDGALLAGEVDVCFGATPARKTTWGGLKQLYR